MFSWYWEQILKVFDDALLEKTAHAQLGHHTRKSQKAWKNNIWWKKCQSMLLTCAVWICHGIRHEYAKKFSFRLTVIILRLYTNNQFLL